MKDFYVNKAKIPHYKLYTILLGLLYFFSGINCLVIHHFHNTSNNSLMDDSLIMGIVFVILVPVVSLDNKHQNRGLSAVIGSACVHLFITSLYAFRFQFFDIYIYYLVEVLVCAFIVLFYFIMNRQGAKHKNR